MALSAGTRLGPYAILGAIGAGGMGEVYRARDTKLDREVAVKVLPAHMAGDAAARTRFEREAKAVAALSHPNILAIHDFGIDGDTAYVVTELLEGETLRDRLSHGPLPVRKAEQIARDIAQGLAAAHDKGIVHRDVKPENVFITASGLVKILDFGLARQTSAPLALDASTAIQMTDPGTVMGTVGYMSPEQVRGQTVDHRSDLFSLGCVLFEAVSGRRPFDRATAAETMTAILREDPPELARSDAPVPAALESLVRHCLEKQPAERFQSARDLAFALQSLSGASTTGGQAAIAPAPTASVRRGPAVAWGVAVAALLVAAVAAWWALRPPPQDVWTGVHLGGPMQAFGMRLSPDGQLLAFLAFEDQLPQVAVMKPDGASWTILTHDRSRGYVTTVSWAPDGSQIYFDRMSGHPIGVYSIPPLGGEPRPLLDAAFAPEALSDGSLVVLKLTDQGDEQVFHYWPDADRLEPLPIFLQQTDVTPMLRAFRDGKALVFYGKSEAGRSQTSRLLVYTFASRTSRELAPGLVHKESSTWSPLAVSPDGQSVYVLSDVGDTRLLLQVPRTSGTPRVLLSFANSASPRAIDVARDGSLYLDQLLSSPSILRTTPAGGSPEEFVLPANNQSGLIAPGGEALLSQPTGGKQELVAVRPGGGPRALVNTTEETAIPATIFGDHVAFNIGSGDAQRIGLATLRDGRVVRRYSSRSDGTLSAAPDGKTLYYSLAGAVWSQPVDGGPPTRITDGDEAVIDPSGQHLYVKRSRQGKLALFRMSAQGTDAEELPVPSEYQVAEVSLSPAAVDARGRILVTVLSQSFYYKAALIDPAAKSFTLIPVAVDGDVAGAGWTSDGHILATGQRYLLSLWRYRRGSSGQ